MKAKVMLDERISLPINMVGRNDLVQVGEVIASRTLNQVVKRAQALSRKLVKGKAGASVDDFLADRAAECK